MHRLVMKSKIHRATVTRSDLDYEGSCSIGTELLAAADIVPGEQVHVVNLSTGARAVTYAIDGAPGEVAMNGGMAHLGRPGDLVIIICYASLDDAERATFTPRVVHVDAANAVHAKAATL